MAHSISSLSKLLSTRSLSRLPLLCFLVLVLANSLLAYSSLSPFAKLSIFLLGLVLPLSLPLLFLEVEKDSRKKESSFPVWAWVLLGLAALGLRFYKLTSLSSWPLVDEGFFNYFPLRLFEKWNWNLQQGPAQEPILYAWGLVPLLKLFQPSLTTLWFFPALLSVASVGVATLAVRRFFSTSIAFWSTAWMALGFWPLYLGRISGPYVLMVFWECLAFYFLARFWTTAGTPRNKTLWVLAIVTGVGFYTYLAWPLMASLIALSLLAGPHKNPRARLETTFKFLVVVILCLLPLAFSYAREYRGYFHDLWSFGGDHDWESRLRLAAAYFTDLFWGQPGVFRYGPLWGGLLNPIHVSLLGLGLIVLLKSLSKNLRRWILAGLFLCFLPALLSRSFQMMRVIALLPLFGLLCALGAQTLLASLPRRSAGWVLGLVLLGSLALDSFHLLGVYPKHWAESPTYYGEHKSPEFHKAYSLLKPIAQEQGPGLILLNFHPDPFDQTLTVATYSFNAAQNPGLNPSDAKWAAVITNVHEQVALKKLFPTGRWNWLSDGLDRPDGGLLLETVSLDGTTREILNRWMKADRALRELTHLVMELGLDPDQSQMKEVLNKAYPLFKGDRLLESRYWRIMALHHGAEGNIAEAVEAEKKAAQLGYPMAHLYNEIGCWLFKEKRMKESEKAFREALRAKPNCTDAAANLENLLRSKKTNPN